MAEGARLESVYTGNRIEGSNPSPSASRCIQEFSCAENVAVEPQQTDGFSAQLSHFARARDDRLGPMHSLGSGFSLEDPHFPVAGSDKFMTDIKGFGFA